MSNTLVDFWPGRFRPFVAVLLLLLTGVSGSAVTIGGFSSVVTLDSTGVWMSLVVDGTLGPRSVMMAAGGPGLAVMGYTGTVSDPKIEIWDGAGNLVAVNDDHAPELLNDINYSILARTPKDAGLRITLTGGVYTIRISDVGGATGVVGFEVTDPGSSPGLISLSFLARTRLLGTADVGTSLVGEGNINLTALVSGPNLPVATPLADPQMRIAAGSTTVSTLGSLTSGGVSFASTYLSPALGDSKNAGHSFLWSVGPLVTPNFPPTFTISNQAGSADGTFLFELHNNDSPTLRPPTILVPPLSATVSSGEALTLRTRVGGQFGVTVQWQRNGVDIPGAQGLTYSMLNVSAADAGSYRVRVTSSVGTTFSPPATVAVQITTPVISVAPQNTAASVGQAVTFNVTASGGNLSYQWRKNGANISGATLPTLTLSSVTQADAGTYSVLVTNTAGTVLSNGASLTVTNLNPGRLINLSVRAFAGTDDRTLIVGFGLSGPGNKRLVIRGIGPELAAYNVPGTLADPRLGLFFNTTEIMSNDNWTTADGRDLGAFALTTGSKDAVISNNFDARSYSAQVTGANRGTGEALVEVYDGAVSNAALRLTNLSARTQLDEGQRLIVGLTVSGATPKTVVLRAVGPGLLAFNLPTAHPDPRMELYAGSVKIAENDSWSGDYGASSGAFPLSVGSKDAVLVRSLPPGGYSLHVLGATGTSGIVLVELYEAP